MVGTFFAMVTGCGLPLNLFVYGEVADNFILYDVAKDIPNLR